MKDCLQAISKILPCHLEPARMDTVRTGEDRKVYYYCENKCFDSAQHNIFASDLFLRWLVLFFFLFLFISVETAVAQNQGPNNGTKVLSLQGCLACPGSIWGNPDSILTSDNQLAMITLREKAFCFQSSCYYSRIIAPVNFGFTIPYNATIDGIEVKIEKFKTTPGNIMDTIVQLYLNNTAIGNNRATTGIWPTAKTIFTYGSSTDTWGATLTPADINDSTFGAVLQIKNDSVSLNETAAIDNINMKVYYTVPSGINDDLNNEKLSVYYDASTKTIKINNAYPLNTDRLSIEIYNALGQLQRKKDFEVKGINFNEGLPVNTLSQGIYFIRIKDSAVEAMRKIMITN